MERLSKATFFCAMKLSVIITAGGVGKRMGTQQPKQFLALNGKAILVHTLERLQGFLPHAEFVLTLPESHLEVGRELLDLHAIQGVKIVAGGRERFHSIQNALVHCHGDFIAIHDGVRPFVHQDTLERLVDAAKIYHAAIPVLPIHDSLRYVNEGKSGLVDRGKYVRVQTPQVFAAKLLQNAYKQPFSKDFTDDASVVENDGHAIHLVPGNPENIKITTPFDLKLAELFV